MIPIPDEKTTDKSSNTDQIVSYEIAHARLMHLGAKGMKDLPNHSTGLKFYLKKNDRICDGCMKGRITRSPFPTNKSKQQINYKSGEMAHLDLRGPYKRNAKGSKNRYALQIVDSATEWSTQYLMQNKNDALKLFKIYYNETETQTKQNKTKQNKTNQPQSSSHFMWISWPQHTKYDHNSLNFIIFNKKPKISASVNMANQTSKKASSLNKKQHCLANFFSDSIHYSS